MELKTIGIIKSDFSTKFGLPRQSGLAVSSYSYVEILPPYNSADAFRGITEYSHLWILWGFNKNPEREEFSPTVRPPKLGGNKRVGVFATRSPNRPNPIGLSCVKLLSVEATGDKTLLKISGADMADGTPVYDIKPYIPFCDCVPQAAAGFTQSTCGHMLKVDMGVDFPAEFSAQQKNVLGRLLAYDPRPGYQHDDEREYAMEYSGYTVRFRVQGDTLYVLCVERV